MVRFTSFQQILRPQARNQAHITRLVLLTKPCIISAMLSLLKLITHLLFTLLKLCQPGGVKSVMAENLALEID
ncbi:MAG: hypothetical protein ACI8QT_001118 [Halioglobus sp.]|jgi:hypothetical protein